ncbi:MAG: N-6 DNA methylase [Planctomycetes bacterium]|nr:N-6 DNA methylase [Planctomycetota bacterium]MCH9775900.1 N-6 DNA methylase [Planctomycetota bacterium]
MNIEQLEQNIQSLVTNLNKETFVYDLLRAYELPKASITRLQKGDYNLSKKTGEILWKKQLFFKQATEEEGDLHVFIDNLKNDPAIKKQHPRFIIVTDFQTLLAVDTKIDDTLDIPLQDFPKHYDFFLPWTGREKSQIQSENPADVKAAEKMGRLYDLILEDNPTENEKERHALNIFLSRLLFCFFAEDTGIYENGQFTNSLASHTNSEGSDLQSYLQKLFTVLSVEQRSEYPQFLQDFPYVNGGLFADEYPVPVFTAKSRKIILECGALNWKAINPDIFGSMIQAVVHNDQRGSMGMHYTSVVNIMKVIEPLFLNDLYEELEQAEENRENLDDLLERIYHLRIFDPACGSGNFLIIAFKELCKLEIEIFKRIYGRQKTFRFSNNVKLTQFYGIELDDFAQETAKLSLWLAEHQMNLTFKAVFNTTRPTLPLQDGGNIVCGNATRLDWDGVCSRKDADEIYILGNPPYLGARNQNQEQKKELQQLLKKIKGANSLDYISCWFFKAAEFIKDTKFQMGFVATNSICQGEQVGLFWPHVLCNGIEIAFAHTSFKWTNNARGNAGVTCVIIGLRNESGKPKEIINNGVSRTVPNITPYLTSNKTIYVYKRKKPISERPEMCYGNQPIEGGFLKLSDVEVNDLLKECPESAKFLRKLIGGTEFLNGQNRWCIWIEDSDLAEASLIPQIAERIQSVKQFREKGGQVAKSLVHRPHQFRYRHKAKESFLLVPCTSSESRQYTPAGFFDKEYLTLHSAQIIYDAPPWILSIISTRIHMLWVKAIGGKFKLDPRYSSVLCYNTFPFPNITEKQKNTLEELAFQVLDEREKHSEKTIAQLYDPDKMPDGLRQAHHEMDLAVEQCYRSKPFTSDEERLEYLFKLYEKMIKTEKSKGKK